MNIGYHTRQYDDPTIKLCGGSFGGDMSMETVNRLITAHGFSIAIKPGGFPVFVDREGREVWLYFTVDARETEAGKKAMAEWRIAEALREEDERIKKEQRAEEIKRLMGGLSHEEIVARLSSRWSE